MRKETEQHIKQSGEKKRQKSQKQLQKVIRKAQTQIGQGGTGRGGGTESAAEFVSVFLVLSLTSKACWKLYVGVVAFFELIAVSLQIVQ